MAQEYKKLAASRYWFRISKLYQGNDHLLLAQTTGYTEEYKRFYFRDIQALLVRPNDRRMGWAIFWGTLLLLLAWLGYALRTSWSFWAWVIPFFPFLALLINLALGRACNFHLKTAIQTVELPIRRIGKARKMISFLSPLIQAAQTDLPEAPGPGETAVPISAPPQAPADVPVTHPQAPQSIKAFNPSIHWALFSLLAVGSSMEMTRFFQQWLSLYLVEAFVSFSTVGAAIGALVRQSQTDVSPALKKISMGAFLVILTQYVLGFIYGYFLAIGHARRSSNPWAWTQWLASRSPDSSTADFLLAGFTILGGLLFGLLGLVELNLNRKRKSASI